MKKVLTLLLAAAVLLVFSGGGKADAGKAATLQAFAEALEEHTVRLEESFTISCDAAVISRLKQPSPIGKDSTLLGELLSMSGSAGSYRYGWEKNGVTLSKISYYAGWRILHLWQSGREDSLSEQERRTLEAALELVSGAEGSDLEKERFLYDALCDRVFYDAEGGKGNAVEKDCAVGALLYGLADCDGYADAMVLLCGLAGIPCRYMHGDSRKPAQPGSPDGNHMWNLVCIDGTWLMCDATWGDQEEHAYLYFNLGTEDAAESYEWCADTLFTPVAGTADFTRHLMADQRPVTVAGMEDVYRAARAATSAGERRLTLFCPDQRLWQTDWDLFVTMLSHGGFGTKSFHDTGRLFEVTNQSIPAVFCFCDSEEDILSAISRYADRHTDAFTLYLSPSISRAMLGDGCEGLRQVFSLSRLEDPGMALNYSEQSGSVTLSGAVYTASLPVCASVEDVAALMDRELPARPGSLKFILGNGFNPPDIGELLAAVVYSHGASSFRYSRTGNRVTVTDIAWYDDFCLASTEEDVTGFLREAKMAGKDSVRIYCRESLYAALRADRSSRFFALLQEAGFSVDTISFNDDYGLLLAENLR